MPAAARPSPADWLDRVADAAGIDRTVGKTQPADLDLAERLLVERHGAIGARFAEQAFGFDTDRPAVFEAKNASLALSVDVSLTWNRLLYLAELELLGRLLGSLRPARIVDLGCEQGIITCFAAASEPEAEVVGIDRSPSAVARAIELAAALGAVNASFMVGDLLDRVPPGPVAGPTLVICSRSLAGEALPDRGEPPWEAESRQAAAKIASSVGDGDLLLLVERGSQAELADWLGILAQAGLEPAGRPTEVDCDEPSNPAQPFTLVALTGRAAGARAAGPT